MRHRLRNHPNGNRDRETPWINQTPLAKKNRGGIICVQGGVRSSRSPPDKLACTGEFRLERKERSDP